ncbi:MAG: outer membrane beta-barrel protein, partial [Rickettsiaceae bacterium]|nr:outer membrane beta-barrel protein [Rickettsiaceae bacterium]
TYKYTLSFSLSYSNIRDYFARVTEAVGENKNFISTRNVADQELVNFSVSYPLKIKDWWSVYANAYVYNSKYIATNPTFISTELTTYGGYAQNTFKLPKDLSFEMSGWFLGPSIWGGTYEIEPLGSLNLAVQKNWYNWSAKVSLNDAFYSIPWSGSTQFGNLFIDGTGGGDTRNVSFYLSHAFGNKEVKNQRDREGGVKDEQNRIGN